jgi:EAL and modified HD-GYP domain-containing signal transduction protein
MSHPLSTPLVEAPDDAPQAGAAALARQAIVDARRTVVGYELYERPRAVASDDAVLFGALSDAGTETLAGKKTVFIRCTFEHMADGHLELLDPERVVLEIPTLAGHSAEDVAIRRSILAQARKSGFRLAFDQSVLQPAFASWLPLASYIKIDMDAMEPGAAESVARSAQSTTKAEIVAEKVKTAEQYERMKRAGVKLFQGHWFAEPSVFTDKTVQASQATIIQLLNLVRRDADVDEIEDLLKKDPTLSFRLLRFINSCGFGLSVEITSFRHAVMILGLNKLFRWATLLMTTARPGGAAPAAGTAAVVRGRLMELLAAELMPKEECDNAFVAGVFSLLDTLLGMPLDKAIESVSLPATVVSALLHNDGALAPFLELAKACESGDEVAFAKAAEELQLSNHQVNWAHLQALVWADQLEGS